MQDAKKTPNTRHLRTIAQLCRAVSSQIKHVLTIGKKKLVKQQYFLHRSRPYGQLAAEIDPVVWGNPANFNGFRILAALLHGSQVVSINKQLIE